MIYKNYTIDVLDVGRGVLYSVRHRGRNNTFDSVAGAMDFIDTITAISLDKITK